MAKQVYKFTKHDKDAIGLLLSAHVALTHAEGRFIDCVSHKKDIKTAEKLQELRIMISSTLVKLENASDVLLSDLTDEDNDYILDKSYKMNSFIEIEY